MLSGSVLGFISLKVALDCSSSKLEFLIKALDAFGLWQYLCYGKMRLGWINSLEE